MLQLSKSLQDIPVMSLRTGGAVAIALAPVINPNNLKIEGWYCRDRLSKKTLILLTKDVRDLVSQGFAVDDYDSLSEPEELIRLQNVLEMKFQLIGMLVVTDTKRRLGKVGDYATDVNTFVIQKLYINQPLYRNLSGSQLSIDRSQIIEITNKQIVVRDAMEQVPSAVGALVGVR